MSEDASPFVLHMLRLDEARNGSFRPDARIALSPALRTSGLLLALPGEDLKRLLLILTFATPNGHVQPSLLELAQALRQPQGATRTQMRRLERFLWQGKPILHELRRESGLHAFAPSPRILGIERVEAEAPREDSPPSRPAPREAVIAHSRNAYARPREEVEREIALANGWEWPPRTLGERQSLLRQKAQIPSINETSMNEQTTRTPDADERLTALRRDLAAWGVPSDLIERLLADYPAERIRQQLDWLPYRKATVPGRLLVAAIHNDYAPPAAIRARAALERAVQEAESAMAPDGADGEAASIDLPLP